MDPTRYLCQIEPIHTKISVEKYKYTTKSVKSPKQQRRELLSPSKRLSKSKTNTIDAIQLPNNIANPLNNASDKFSPLELVMANIDAVFNLTDQDGGYLTPQYIKDYDVVDRTGTSINYFQYRVPTARFFTKIMSKYLDYRQVNIVDSGEEFSSYTRSISPEGVDLVIDTTADPTSIKLIQALEMCRPGGKWICRLDKLEPDLLFIAALCFETITLFQPMADNLNLDRFYLIAENFSGTANDWIQILSSEDVNLDIPEDFYDYLDKFIQEYLDLTELLKTQELSGPIYNDRSSGPIYNVYKCKSLWNIF